MNSAFSFTMIVMLISFVSAEHFLRHKKQHSKSDNRYTHDGQTIGYNKWPVIHQHPVYIPRHIIERCKKKYICGIYGEGYYANMECINVLSVCNGIRDCTDGIDELHCTEDCAKQGKMLCNDKITCAVKCNGIPECPFGEDEINCLFTCGPGKYQCKGNRKWCINADKICNGKHDCPEYDDEVECPGTTTKEPCDKSCPRNTYTCSDGSCIPIHKICDGKPNDCVGNDDEVYCPDDCNQSCGPYKFQCLDGTCLTIDKICNKHPDCDSHEDEVNCPPCPNTCGPGMYTCADKSCVRKDRICDGRENDCPDNEDEIGCPPSCQCQPGQYICKENNLCIDEDTACETSVPGCEDASEGSDLCT